MKSPLGLSQPCFHASESYGCVAVCTSGWGRPLLPHMWEDVHMWMYTHVHMDASYICMQSHFLSHTQTYTHTHTHTHCLWERLTTKAKAFVQVYTLFPSRLKNVYITYAQYSKQWSYFFCKGCVNVKCKKKGRKININQILKRKKRKNIKNSKSRSFSNAERNRVNIRII